MYKELVENYEAEKCPICGSWAEWQGSEMDNGEFSDNYKCSECGTPYSIIYYMNYKYHLIEE